MQNQKQRGTDLCVPIPCAPLLSRGAKAPPTLGADAEDLTAFVVAAGSAGGVRLNGAAALRALVQDRRAPAMRRFPRPQSHFRSFTLGNSHGERERKHRFGKRQGCGGDLAQGSRCLICHPERSEGSLTMSALNASSNRRPRQKYSEILRQAQDDNYGSFSLSSALQSGVRFPSVSAAGAAIVAAGHCRPPSRSQ